MKKQPKENILNNLSNLLSTPIFPITIEVGKVYKINQDVPSMDTWHIMKIINKFLDSTSKEYVHVEIGNVGKTLPTIEPHLPYIVIESSAKGILKSQKNLAKRKYVTLIDSEFTPSDQLAMMVISIME